MTRAFGAQGSITSGEGALAESERWSHPSLLHENVVMRYLRNGDRCKLLCQLGAAMWSKGLKKWKGQISIVVTTVTN